MNVISPTGMVHAVETDEGKWGVIPVCHHTQEWDYNVFWEKTDKKVTCKRCLQALQPKMTRIIHVNQHVIKHNLKYGVELPPCRVQEGSKSRYCREVQINGPSRMVYHPNDPLSCGARLWIETDAPVVLLDEVEYNDIREAMEKDREAAFTTSNNVVGPIDLKHKEATRKCDAEG